MKSSNHMPQVKTLKTIALETIIMDLHKACEMGGQDVADYVEKILDETYRQLNIDQDMPLLWPGPLNHDTLLTIACRTGNTAIVKNLLLRCGEHVSVTDSNEGAVIETSAEIDGYSNKSRLARMINYVNHDGETALTLACQKGYVAIVQLLLGALFDADKREAINHVNKDGDTALICAIKQNSDFVHISETVKVILESCSANDRLSALNHEDKDGDTALFISSRRGDVLTVKVILEACSDRDRFSALNHRNKNGDTALLIASRMGDAETVKVILAACSASDRFSALNHEDNYGNTALLIASRMGDAETVKVILEACSASDRFSALQHICQSGRTALFYAARYCNADIVRLLLSVLPKTDKFQAIFHTDNDGNNSLSQLCHHLLDSHLDRFQDTVKALFEPLFYTEKLAIVEHPNNEGRTVLSSDQTGDQIQVKNFVAEQLKREAQQQCHASILEPQSIFSDSASERLPSNAPAG